MIPIHELTSPAVACAWHEVAALVLDAATAVSERDSSDLSDLTKITLADDGYVVLPDGGRHEPPAIQLARLLDTLLRDLPAPDALRALATRHLAAPPSESSLEAFVSELSRFERPDRAGILSQLAARAAAVDRRVDGPTALAQLASRVRENEEAGRAGAAHATTTPQRRTRRSALTIVAVGVAAGAAAFLAAAYRVAPPAPEGGPDRPVVARISAGAAELVASARQALQSTPPPEAAPPPAAPPATPSTDRRRAAATPVRPAAPPDLVVSMRSIEPPGPAPEPEAATPGAAPADATVYTSADADVAPASLLRPHLPSHPPSTVTPDDVGTLELTVTETGSVAHVKLTSPSGRYQERMLVAAAKSWRFQPATKDGRPVRFLARVRITL